jgi:prepilin-type N-terminal cleavage/methylation domain-containing protein
MLKEYIVDQLKLERFKGPSNCGMRNAPACPRLPDGQGIGRECGTPSPTLPPGGGGRGWGGFPACHGTCSAGRRIPNSPLPTGERVGVRGFTLIEVILVMVIIGILSATVVSRINFTLPTTTSVDGAAYIVASDIRYAQEYAMANGAANKSISFTSGSSSYTFSPTSKLDPSGQLSTGAVVGTTIMFTFNSLGEPIRSGGNSVIVRDVGSTEQRTIQVQNYTGKVNISNP